MQGFITVNWQVFYRKKDKMAGVKNNPGNEIPVSILVFFSSGIIVVETFDYHSSCQPKTRRRAQTSK